MTKQDKKNASLKKEIGLRFKEFRQAIKETQYKMASELNVKKSTISGIETGKTFPGVILQQYLHHQYNLNINWLITGSAEMLLPLTKNSKYAELPILFWTIKESDPSFERYVELISLMRIPLVKQIIFGKLEETKAIAKKEIKSFFEDS